MNNQQGKDVPRGYSAAYHQVAGGAQQKKKNKLAPVHSFATSQKSTSKSKLDYAAHDRLLMPPLKYNGDGLIQLKRESNVLMTKPNNNECKIAFFFKAAAALQHRINQPSAALIIAQQTKGYSSRSSPHPKRFSKRN